MNAVQVCIIGYGPVGAALANLLGQMGVSVLVLERESNAYHLPRAVHFDDEVMRVFETIGLAERIAPMVHVSPGMRFLAAKGSLLLEWPRPQDIGPMGWHSSYRFHQPDLERVLRDGTARFPSVHVRTQAEALALDEDADGVTVRWEDLATGTLHRSRADYVVGCDGARSFVRRKIGDTPIDLGFAERWLVVDAILKRPAPHLGDWSVQYCNPDRAATYVRGTGDRRRWEIAIHPHEDSDRVIQPDAVWDLLAPWITPADAELERAACYMFRSVIARPWRLGRLLLAGDAAHQTPPFLGQGMCAGIRDVANLAWKLDRVLRGVDPEALLDTYETERSSHTHAYIAMAVRLGGLINTKAMQAALPPDQRGDEPARMSSIRPELGPGLAAGWDGVKRWTAPQVTLSDRTRLDARTGYRHALWLTPDATLTDAQHARLAAREVAVVQDRALLPWLQENAVVAAAIRPDRYVLGAARDAAERDRLVDQI